MIVPGGYARAAKFYVTDIALVELTEDVPLSDNVKPVEVDWQNKVHLKNGHILTVSINIMNTVFRIYFLSLRPSGLWLGSRIYVLDLKRSKNRNVPLQRTVSQK